MTAVNGTPSKGRAVGALACQSSSYQTTLDTEVVSCVKAIKAEQNGGKKSKKKEEEPVEDQWLIECADSVLFPEGGGQPCDHGTLEVLDDDKSAPVIIKKVQREGLRCIIYSPQPIPAGAQVRQHVDWKRRWDHMQQHTGQHLLSAVMSTFAPDLDTVGWGMGVEGTMNYIDLPRKPTQDELQEVQDLCAQEIRENHSIRLETPENAKDSSLPDDYDKADGVVRVIHIGDLDANTCCGTHLKQTSHIGLIIFGSTSPVHGKNCRLQFMAGDRALKFASSAVDALSSIAKLTSSKSEPAEVLKKVSETSEALAESRRNEKKLLLEVAKLESERVKAVLRSGKNALVHRSSGGTEFINKVIGEVGDELKNSGLVVAIAMGEVKESGPVVIAGDKEAVAAMVEKVKAVVTNIKGGGGGNKWQGKVPEWQKADLKEFKAMFEQQ